MIREQGPIPNWRVRGGVLAAVGLFLVLFMAAIAWSLAPVMLAPGVAVGGTTFTGTELQGRIFLALFALVGLFGAFCVANGAYMMATGRRSPRLARIFLLLFLLLLGLGWAIRGGMV